LDSDAADVDGLNLLSTEAPNVDPFLAKSELEAKVAILEHQLHDVKGRLNQTKTQLALEQSRRPAQYDDQYFTNQLVELRNLTRHWSNSYFRHCGGYLTIPAERNFRCVSDEWAAYLEFKDKRPWLIQARLWDSLQRRVFDVRSDSQYGYVFAGRDKKYAVDKILVGGSNGPPTLTRPRG
jgi:hypothetical protein